MSLIRRLFQRRFFTDTNPPVTGMEAIGEALMCSRFPVPPLFPGGPTLSLSGYLSIYGKTDLSPEKIAQEVDEATWIKTFEAMKCGPVGDYL